MDIARRRGGSRRPLGFPDRALRDVQDIAPSCVGRGDRPGQVCRGPSDLRPAGPTAVEFARCRGKMVLLGQTTSGEVPLQRIGRDAGHTHATLDVNASTSLHPLTSSHTSDGLALLPELQKAADSSHLRDADPARIISTACNGSFDNTYLPQSLVHT